MSRLDSFIRRMQAQRDCLNAAAGLIADVPGVVFDLGLGNGRTFDHLREVRTVCHCGRKATMNLRRQADGRAVAEGEQVAVEKSDYVSLCRKHFFEALAG